MSADRGAFVCQSQSLNIFMENANFGKLTSMHFYGWKKGLKTGMYYLRTKSAVDAIKFTVTKEKKEEPKPEAATKPVINMAPEATSPAVPTEQTKIVETNESYSFQNNESSPVVEPLASPMQEPLAQNTPVTSTPASNEPMFMDQNDAVYQAAKLQCSIDNPDDCEMCGS